MNSEDRNRVIILSEHFRPSHGATAQLMGDLADGLNAEGWNVVVLTSTPGGREKYMVQRFAQGGNMLRNRDAVYVKTIRGLWFLIECLVWVLLHARQKDILLVVSNPPFAGIVGLCARLLVGLPYIFVFQDLFPKSAVLSGVLSSGSKVEATMNYIMSTICRYAESTVILGERMRRKLKEEMGEVGDTQVIHNWAVEKALPILRSESQLAREFDFQDRFCVQYSGNFGRLHDFETILETANLLKQESSEIQFTLIGGGAKSKQIHWYKETYGLDRVLILPYRKRCDLPMSLAACDIAVITLVPGAEEIVAPSKFYGILASRRPVLYIGNKNSDIARLVIQHKCGIVCSNRDAMHMAESISRLSQMPEEVELMGDRAYKLYESRFGLRRSVLSYSEVLKSARRNVR